MSCWLSIVIVLAMHGNTTVKYTEHINTLCGRNAFLQRSMSYIGTQLPAFPSSTFPSLRFCATNRKVVGSIPDGVSGFFIDIRSSVRAMALGSTQPLTEMSTRSISWGLRRPVRKADNLTTILCRCHDIWEP